MTATLGSFYWLGFETTGLSPDKKRLAWLGAQQINSVIKKQLIDSLPKSNRIERKLLFGAFSNEARVRFILSFTQISDGGGAFLRASDLGVRPDDKMGEVMKDELKWMLHKVSELRLNGSAVHQVEFMVDSAYHPSILITRMEAEYCFTHSCSTGTYTATFEFSDYSRRGDNAEFQIAISKLKVKENKDGVPLSHVEKQAFGLLDRHKDGFWGVPDQCPNQNH